jgi:hypothetical protein
MLISMPTGTSTIFGAFQAISLLQCYGASAAWLQGYVRRSNGASLRLSHLKVVKRAGEQAWAAFHKSGARTPYSRRYSPRYTAVAI